MVLSSVVHKDHSHMIYRGDSMERKFAATYHSKTGKSITHIVAPPPMTSEEIDAILKDYQRVVWRWWQSLSIEEQLEINNKLEMERGLTPYTLDIKGSD